MSAFPPELEDLIIDHVRGDKKTLASCGLVSRSWLHISRPYLFGSVILRDHTYEEFLQLKASRHCTFIPSIRTLSISRPKKDMDFSKNFLELISKLPGLPYLSCLRMFYVRCTDLSADFVTKFVAVFHDITELDIQHTTLTSHHVIALLARLPRLKKVTVRTMLRKPATGMQKLPELPMPPDPPRLQVVRLCLYHAVTCLGILKWINKGLPTVRTLRLNRIWPKDLPDVGTHLRALGPTLRDLDLDFMTPTFSGEVSESLAPHLTCLAHVAHLTVRVGLDGPTPEHWDAYWTLLAALPRAPAALETLTIVLTGRLVYLEHLDWVHFHATVRAHTRLRLLRFLVDRRLDAEWAAKEIRNRVEPEFAARGSVEVDFNNFET